MRAALVIRMVILLLLMAYMDANAQFIISGQVLDKATKDPLPNTIIKVFVQGDSLSHVAIADELGRFRIPLGYGKYKLTFFFLGYDPQSLTLTVDSSLSLGKIYLSPEPEQIKEVKIKIKPSQVHIDKKVYIITDSIRRGSAKASQLFNKLPEVSCDPASQSVSVLGSENVLILVDGVPRDPKSILNMPASQIAKIEVITEPTGRYALAGYTAIINVITRQHLRGFEAYFGSFSEFYLITPTYTKTWTNREPYVQLQVTLNKTTLFLYGDITKHFGYYSYYNTIATPTDTITITNDHIPAKETQDFHTLEFGIIHELSPTFKSGFVTMIDLYGELDELNLHDTRQNKNIFLNESFNENDYLFLAFTEGQINSKWQTNIMPEVSINTSARHLKLLSDSQISSNSQDKSLSLKLTWDNTIYTDSNTRLNFGTVIFHQQSQGIVSFLGETPFTSQFSSSNIFISYLFPVDKWQVKLSINTGFYRLVKNEWKYELLPDVKIKRGFSKDMISIRAGYRLKRHIPELVNLHSGRFLMSDFITRIGNTSLMSYYEHFPYIEVNIAEAILLKPYLKISPHIITQYYFFDSLKNTVVSMPVNSDRSITTGISGYISFPISHFIFIMVQGDMYKQSLTYNQTRHSIFMKHLHGVIYLSLFDEKVYLFLQSAYHDFYNLGINGFSKDYLSAFLAGFQLSLLDDNLSISLMYNLPIQDRDNTLFSEILYAKADRFYVFHNLSTKQFAFNPKYPYFTFDIYFNISKGFVHQVTPPDPSLQDEKEIE